MTDNKQFDVVFEGKLVDGADPGTVRGNVARLFKTDAGKLDKLFSGKRFVIKSNVDELTAQKYLSAMRKAGAVCEVLVKDGAMDGPPVSAGNYTVAPPGVTMDETPPPEAPSIDTAALSMMDPGVDMEDGGRECGGAATPRPIEADIAPPGVVLVEPQAVETPPIHIEGLSMAEPGADLVEAPPEGPAAIPDISRYTLAPPGQPVQGEEDPSASYLKSLGLD